MWAGDTPLRMNNGSDTDDMTASLAYQDEGQVDAVVTSDKALLSRMHRVVEREEDTPSRRLNYGNQGAKEGGGIQIEGSSNSQPTSI